MIIPIKWYWPSPAAGPVPCAWQIWVPEWNAWITVDICVCRIASMDTFCALIIGLFVGAAWGLTFRRPARPPEPPRWEYHRLREWNRSAN